MFSHSLIRHCFVPIPWRQVWPFSKEPFPKMSLPKFAGFFSHYRPPVTGPVYSTRFISLQVAAGRLHSLGPLCERLDLVGTSQAWTHTPSSTPHLLCCPLTGLCSPQSPPVHILPSHFPASFIRLLLLCFLDLGWSTQPMHLSSCSSFMQQQRKRCSSLMKSEGQRLFCFSSQ